MLFRSTGYTAWIVWESPRSLALRTSRRKWGWPLTCSSPLEGEPDLLQTLKVFLDQDCVSSQAAERLAVHRNTLAYRLDKIQALTGLDLHRFDEAVQLRLALLLRNLAA